MIIFLYGPDTFRSLGKLRDLKEKFKKDVPGGALNLAEIEGEKLTFAEFKKELNTVSFMAKRRMVIFKNIVAKGTRETQKEIINFLKSREEGKEDNILIFWEEEPGKQPLFEFLAKARIIRQEFSLLTEHELKNWIAVNVRAKGGSIETSAVSALAERVGNNLWQMNNELDKLISFARSVSEENILRMVKVKDDENIFNLTDAIGSRDKKKALKLLEEQLRFGANINYILTMLAREYRLLMEVKDYLNRNARAASASVIAKDLKLHPFVVKKLLAQERLYKMEELAKMYSRILKIDLKTKTSGLDVETLLDVLIVSDN